MFNLLIISDKSIVAASNRDMGHWDNQAQEVWLKKNKCPQGVFLLEKLGNLLDWSIIRGSWKSWAKLVLCNFTKSYRAKHLDSKSIFIFAVRGANPTISQVIDDPNPFSLWLKKSIKGSTDARKRGFLNGPIHLITERL